MQKSTGLARVLTRLIVIALVIGGAVFAHWLYQLDRKVVAQFEGRKWAVPAHVYTRPQEIHPGLKLDQNDFVNLLERLGYRRVDRIERIAHYQINDDSVSLITRPQAHQQQADLALRVAFGQGRIKTIINLRDSTQMPVFSLEPQLIGSLRPGQHEDRTVISIHDMPQIFLLMLLATEDRGFFNHHGVHVQGVARAMVANFKAGRVVQGGSTITQQLIKNFYLTSERTIKRKLKEMVMAVLLELHYEKWQILETYINEVYLGQAGNRAIHGFELASKFYFGRPMRELDVHESALLVGLIKGPSFYNPLRNPERAMNRRNVILDILQAEQDLPQDWSAKLKQTPLGVKENTIIRNRAHPAFLDLIRRQLTQQYDESLLQSEGMAIYTTMDFVIQQAADRVLKQTIEQIESQRNIDPGTLQGAVVVLHASSGEILALSADRNAQFAGFNRALDAKRPIGSLVKPAVYLTALEQPGQYTLMSSIADSPYTISDAAGKKWSPGNYDNRYHGNVTLLEALARSYNIPAVRVGMKLGVDRVIDTMYRLGLRSPVKAYPSTLLGASQHTPLEVAQMFQTIANDGYHSPLRGILTLRSAADEPIEHYPREVQRVVTPAASHLLDFALKQVVASGTARSISGHFPKDYGLAGKTGTTNDYRDSWFAGYSGDLVGVVWLGRDDNKSTGLTGASGALKVWQALFSQLRLREWPDPPPPDVRYLAVNKLTGFKTDPNCELSISIPFQSGSEPSQSQGCHEVVNIDQPEVAAPREIPRKSTSAGVVEDVKNWFDVLFGGGDNNNQAQNGAGSNRK